jgi:2-polyprenyl-3-methyl-5-hydroxy-6-metoxy-1,4-benzoquinol methylase
MRLNRLLGIIRGIVTADFPLRAMVYTSASIGHKVLRTGNRKYELEALHAHKKDPWNYEGSEAEQQKYREILECIKNYRRKSDSVLEVGCSIGVFTGMLTDHFKRVFAIDVAVLPLRQARRRKSCRDVTFVRADLREIALEFRFDVIVLAEILYYLRKQDVPSVVEKLLNHLSQDGIIVLSSGSFEGTEDYYYNRWAEDLGAVFEEVGAHHLKNPWRYDIHVFSRRRSLHHANEPHLHNPTERRDSSGDVRSYGVNASR